jgi:hypothetical protein
VRLELKVVMQNDKDFMDVILMYVVRNLDSTLTDLNGGSLPSHRRMLL